MYIIRMVAPVFRTTSNADWRESKRWYDGVDGDRAQEVQGRLGVPVAKRVKPHGQRFILLSVLNNKCQIHNLSRDALFT